MRVRRCLALAVLALLVLGAGPGQDRKEGITDSAEEILRQAPERIKEFSNLPAASPRRVRPGWKSSKGWPGLSPKRI